MIDHLLGRPSAAFKRTQTFLVLLFWAVFILKGDRNGPPLVRWFSNKLRGKLTPWQVLAGTLTCLYAIKNADSVLGLQAPEPLARLYSRDFYRATWIAVALDTGHASAMHVRPKWLRHFLSMLFSGYYLVFANEADEKLRKYRAVCTVELLRATWEKTSNPIIRLVTALRTPKVQIKRKFLLPRPQGSPYSKPVVAWLYFAGNDEELERSRDLMLDLPGGGFVCMDPSHHDERLHHWTIRTGKPLLAVDYAKAPEYPYPYAMHECFDVYRLLHETKGYVIGLRSGEIRIVVSGDSAGANIGAAMMIKLLEMPAASRPPLPLSLIWTYPALDFNFTSFMPPEHLRILRQESSSALRGIAEQKDHLKHQSPLAVVEDESDLRQRRRRSSWAKSFSKLPFVQGLKSPSGLTPSSPATGRRGALLPLAMTPTSDGADVYPPAINDTGHEGDTDGEGEELVRPKREREKSLSERVQYWNPDRGYAEMDPAQLSALSDKQSRSSAIGTRLTMTSRTGFFNDRIISPSMMRAMAICYVGPRNSPDLSKNYYISPILTPANLLAQYPHVYLLCGERDPFSDDTLIFSGRLRDAKLERKAELLAKQNKFGEGLRMSNANPSNREPILDETEDDWVTMRFIEGWSHGFMQMATLLPKVMHFYDLTADWASFSFTKYEAQQRHPDSIVNAVQVPTVSYPEPGQDSTASEKEEEVLSFKPRRRGSRTSSPAPGSGTSDVPTSGSIRAQLRQDIQPGLNASLVDATVSDMGASSSSGSERNNSPASTAATSMASLDGTQARLRRASPGEGPGRMGPVERVLREEADVLPGFGKQSSGGRRASESSNNLPNASHVRSGSGSSVRRGSDVAENAVAASAFVEAHDLLKRRREDAMAGLTGSAVLSSSESDEERKKQTRKKESQRTSASQSRSTADRDAGLLDAHPDPAVP